MNLAKSHEIWWGRDCDSRDLLSSGWAESPVCRIRQRLLLILLPISIFDVDDFDCYATRWQFPWTAKTEAYINPINKRGHGADRQSDNDNNRRRNMGNRNSMSRSWTERAKERERGRPKSRSQSHCHCMPLSHDTLFIYSNNNNAMQTLIVIDCQRRWLLRRLRTRNKP